MGRGCSRVYRLDRLVHRQLMRNSAREGAKYFLRTENKPKKRAGITVQIRAGEKESLERASETASLAAPDSCLLALAFDLAEKPGPGMSPIVVGGPGGNAEDLSRFV